MKNYKHILEAVNRGLQLALDDFDDVELVLNIKSKQVLNRDYTKEYLDLMEEVVDLGLPSGTLWCKCNLGAACKLNNIESWYGDFYAWGEIKPNKPTYDMESYKFGNGSVHADELSKYITLEEFTCNPFNDDSEILSLVDNLTNLQEVDDAAYQNKKLYNFKFHIPTKELCEELLKYTTYKTTTNYKGINFLAGGIFTSKINGEELFFPFAGWKDDNGKVIAIKSYGYYWSSTLNAYNNANAYYLNIYWDVEIDSNGEERYGGFKIRPVINL